MAGTMPSAISPTLLFDTVLQGAGRWLAMAEQARSHSLGIFNNFQEEVKKAAAGAPAK
jgi:hypothetical protein